MGIVSCYLYKQNAFYKCGNDTVNNVQIKTYII